MTDDLLTAPLVEEFSAIAARCGCELLDARFRSGTLRLVIDREAGIDVEDCARVSREVSALLDVEDFGPARYSLEVTSPGLDREFYRESDYQRFAGRDVRVTWRNGRREHKQTAVGRLAAAHLDPEDQRFIELETDTERLEIPLPKIVRTRLVPEI